MKKIAIAVLAFAMIFAIVACEATTQPTWYGKRVSNVTVESAPAYFEGETINPADITLKIQYDNGTATVNGAAAGLIPETGTSYAAAADYTALTLEYGVDYDGKVLPWTVYVPTVKATGLTITAPVYSEVIDSEEDLEAIVNGVTFTLSYDGGSKAVSEDIASKLAPYSIESTEVKSADGKTVQVTITAKKDANSTIPVTMNAVTYTYSTVDPSKTVASVDLVWDDSQEFFAVNGKWKQNHAATSVESSAATLGIVKYSVVATMADGSKVPLNTANVTSPEAVDAENEAYVDFDYSTSQKLTGLTTFNATVTYMLNGKVETEKATLEIKYTDDYVLTFSVTPVTADAKYNLGDAISEGNFIFAGETWASGYTEYTTAEKSLDSAWFDIQPNYVPKGYTGSSPMAITNIVVRSSAADKVQGATWAKGTGLSINVNLPSEG